MDALTKIGVYLLRFVMVKVFFKRRVALLLCAVSSIFFYILGEYLNKPNLFSSSGAIFTIAGFLLNIKLTANFHLDIGVESKYASMTGRGMFGGGETLEEKQKVVKDVELDEVVGVFMIIVGTVISGFF